MRISDWSADVCSSDLWLQADARNGALTMAAFGLGTLPMMLPLTWSGARMKLWLQHGRWRITAALLVLLAGLLTIAAPWLMHVPALHDTLAALDRKSTRLNSSH